MVIKRDKPMKTRLFIILVLIVGVTLLTLLVPGHAAFTVAPLQRNTTFSQVHTKLVMKSTPIMFIGYFCISPQKGIFQKRERYWKMVTWVVDNVRITSIVSLSHTKDSGTLAKLVSSLNLLTHFQNGAYRISSQKACP